jgi:peptidyl-dipeptidase Dcp
MNHKLYVPVTLALIFVTTTFSACAPGNPLLEEEWDTPFGVPPFDRIENEHYLEAFRTAMAKHDAEIDAIVNNPEPPTFANTIEAFERSGGMLSRVSRVFGAVDGANTNDTLQEIGRELAPERAAHGDNIGLNPDLYARVKAVYDQRDQLNLPNSSGCSRRRTRASSVVV